MFGVASGQKKPSVQTTAVDEVAGSLSNVLVGQ